MNGFHTYIIKNLLKPNPSFCFFKNEFSCHSLIPDRYNFQWWSQGLFWVFNYQKQDNKVADLRPKTSSLLMNPTLIVTGSPTFPFEHQHYPFIERYNPKTNTITKTYMDLDDLNKVWEIKPLKKIGEADARKLLDEVAKQVQPIMKKHKWKVRVLSEFCPANPALMGLNIGGGAEVKLRLRRPNSEWDFFPYEQVLDTMLHELCHNEYGPHNSGFYGLLDQIRKECEELMAKGISGTGRGFDLPGRRLGGFSHQLPLSSLRQSALAAAENRARRGALLPSGPNRVGGDSNIKAALSPIQAAAMAAERRMHDDLWCGSKSSDGVIGVEGNVERPESSGTSITSEGLSIQTSFGKSMSGQELANGHPSWQCNTCTLLNQPLALICEACGTSRHKDVSKFKVWPCKFCTLDNSVELDRCLACGEWRYSYGPPVSAPGPYVGT